MTRALASLTLFAISSAAATELPAGAEIQIRLNSKVSSSTSKSGDPVKATVIVPVLAGGQVAIPAGALITGKIKEVGSSKKGTERAVVDLDFQEVSGSGMKPAKIAAQLIDVDNVRESVDEKGRIIGLLASETISAQVDKGIEKVNQRSSGLADVLQVAKSAFMGPAEVEITYQPGAEMTLKLSKNLKLDSATAAAGRPYGDLKAIRNEADLGRLVTAQPFRTIALKPPQPSDMTNVMLVGSQQQLEAAFAAAGWKTAAALNARSGLETFRAIAEARGYQEAPMSILLLEGQKPDLVFQKQNNTFAKRHHLRIWKRPVQFEGQDVWVVAATHDIGIEFSPESRTFIHKIDPNIDRERAKVANDLLMTGMVKSLALVERPEAPTRSQNATGDNLETDGSMAVLLLGKPATP